MGLRHSQHNALGSTPAAVLLIPAALGVFTMLAVILTIRVIGFAVTAGLGVFFVSFVLTMILQALFGRER